jgi:hypothetical protein
MCEWMIVSSHVLDGNPLVTFHFTNFSTQPQNDIVRVLECIDIWCLQHQQLAELSGAYFTTKVIASATGYMKVVFTSDGSINSNGFTGFWNSVSIHMFSDFILPKTCICMLIFPGFPAFSEIFFLTTSGRQTIHVLAAERRAGYSTQRKAHFLMDLAPQTTPIMPTASG